MGNVNTPHLKISASWTLCVLVLSRTCCVLEKHPRVFFSVALACILKYYGIWLIGCHGYESVVTKKLALLLWEVRAVMSHVVWVQYSVLFFISGMNLDSICSYKLLQNCQSPHSSNYLTLKLLRENLLSFLYRPWLKAISWLLSSTLSVHTPLWNMKVCPSLTPFLSHKHPSLCSLPHSPKTNLYHNFGGSTI